MFKGQWLLSLHRDPVSVVPRALGSSEFTNIKTHGKVKRKLNQPSNYLKITHFLSSFITSEHPEAFSIVAMNLVLKTTTSKPNRLSQSQEQQHLSIFSPHTAVINQTFSPDSIKQSA